MVADIILDTEDVRVEGNLVVSGGLTAHGQDLLALLATLPQHASSMSVEMLRIELKSAISRILTSWNTEVHWWHCRKCHCLFRVGERSACPAGGSHSGQGSGRYALMHSTPELPNAFHTLHRCGKCQSLVLEHKPTLHRPDHDRPEVRSLRVPTVRAVCAADQGEHDTKRSMDYVLELKGTNTTLQYGWRVCVHCTSIYHAPTGAGSCAAHPGGHEFAAADFEFGVLHEAS